MDAGAGGQSPGSTAIRPCLEPDGTRDRGRARVAPALGASARGGEGAPRSARHGERCGLGGRHQGEATPDPAVALREHPSRGTDLRSGARLPRTGLRRRGARAAARDPPRPQPEPDRARRGASLRDPPGRRHPPAASLRGQRRQGWERALCTVLRAEDHAPPGLGRRPPHAPPPLGAPGHRRAPYARRPGAGPRSLCGWEAIGLGQRVPSDCPRACVPNPEERRDRSGLLRAGRLLRVAPAPCAQGPGSRGC